MKGTHGGYLGSELLRTSQGFRVAALQSVMYISNYVQRIQTHEFWVSENNSKSELGVHGQGRSDLFFFFSGHVVFKARSCRSQGVKGCRMCFKIQGYPLLGDDHPLQPQPFTTQSNDQASPPCRPEQHETATVRESLELRSHVFFACFLYRVCRH